MHGWPVTQSILLLQRGRAPLGGETDWAGELPETLVASTTRTIMQIGAGPNSDSSSIDPRVRWLVQEALKGLAEN
jgi:hypothetical protein